MLRLLQISLIFSFPLRILKLGLLAKALVLEVQHELLSVDLCSETRPHLYIPPLARALSGNQTFDLFGA